MTLWSRRNSRATVLAIVVVLPLLASCRREPSRAYREAFFRIQELVSAEIYARNALIRDRDKDGIGEYITWVDLQNDPKYFSIPGSNWAEIEMPKWSIGSISNGLYQFIVCVADECDDAERDFVVVAWPITGNTALGMQANDERVYALQIDERAVELEDPRTLLGRLIAAEMRFSDWGLATLDGPVAK